MIVLRNLKNTLHLPYNINIKYAYLQIAKIKIICLNKFFKDNRRIRMPAVNQSAPN